MGVLISSDKAAVIVDGLHTFYREAYLPPPDSVVEAIMQQQGVYNNLRYALFTHHHRDHFSSMLSRRFLQVSPANKVAGSRQILDSLLPKNPAIVNAWDRNGVILRDVALDVTISSFNIPHTGYRGRHASVQNIAYVITMNGNTVLHIGDAETETADAFARFNDLAPDVAVVPIWFLHSEDGRRIISSIAPKMVIATHIEPGATPDASALHLKTIPTYFFTWIGQVIP